MRQLSSFLLLVAVVFLSHQETGAELDLISPRSDIPCASSSVNYNVTLSKGTKAGRFYKLDDVTNMEGCLEHCCKAKKCDVAFVVSNKCYLVGCHDKESCKIKRSENAKLQTSLAVVPRFHSKKSSIGSGGEPEISENLQAKASNSNPFVIEETNKNAQNVHAFGTTSSKRSKRSSDVIDLVVAVGCGTIAVAVGVAGVIMMTRRLIDKNKSSSS